MLGGPCETPLFRASNVSAVEGIVRIGSSGEAAVVPRVDII
jgi:hypothetical protein